MEIIKYKFLDKASSIKHVLVIGEWKYSDKKRMTASEVCGHLCFIKCNADTTLHYKKVGNCVIHNESQATDKLNMNS